MSYMSIIRIINVLVAGCLITACASVENFDLTPDSSDVKKDTATMSSTCNRSCRNHVMEKLNISNIKYRSHAVDRTRLASVDGVYDRYSDAWHEKYNVTITAGNHELTTRVDYCYSRAKETKFSFTAEKGHRYFVGDAVLEKGMTKKGYMHFSWTPVVFDIDTQTLVYPSDVSTWKEDVQHGGSLCL